MDFPPDPIAPLQADIARLTRERDEAQAKVAGMRAVLKAGCELLDIESEALRNSIRIVGDPDKLSDAPEDAPTHEAIREMEDWIQTAGTFVNDPDATAALNRVRAVAMREAAGIAADYWREMHSPDQRGPVSAAILARADAVERGE